MGALFKIMTQGLQKLVRMARDTTQLREADRSLRRLSEEPELRVADRTEELQKRERQLLMITNALPVFVGHVDKDEKLLFVSEALAD